MKKFTIGYSGGGLIAELGSVEDVQTFFSLIQKYVVSKHPTKNWSILIDRLYKRYLKAEELEIAIELMKIVEDEFKKKEQLRINSGEKSIFTYFKSYFEKFLLCAEMIQLSYEEFGSSPDYKYEPMKLVITDLPWYLIEQNRSLDEYDKLSTIPFWLREN